MNFSRKTIFVVGAALLAACGDKVTVTETPPVTPVAKVNFVEVTPATATVSAGASITFTAAVNADAGLATTVTWSASAGTVTSAGVFTAPATANPGISVCATSTVDTGKKGCATVVVSPPAATFPATVSIASITTGGLNTPVNPANVFGQMDVTLNINPGTQTISKVELLIGGVVAGTQTFTAAQSAALRFAADEAIAAQTTFPQVVFSINTGAFNATTGIPTWYNGTQTVQAKIYTTAGGSTTAASASVSQTLTFNNANTYVLTSSTSGASVIGANFYKYSTGTITATVLPVIYTSGLTLASGTLSFGAAGCDAFGPRTMTLASNVATFTKSNTAGPAATNFRLYEFRTATPACPIATGEGFTLTAIDNAGNGLFAAAVPANNVANLYRMDNVAPGAPSLIQNPGARQNGWVNAAIGFTTTNASSAANGMAVNGAADLGVGGYIRNARIAAATGGLVDAAIAATASTTPALPAPSLSPTDYCLVLSATDALGNESALPAAATVCSAPAVASATALAATHTRFGVDIAAPTVAFSGGLASNGRISAAAVGGEFQVTVLDTGTVGNSGMLSGSSVMGTVIIRNASALSPVCFLGAVVSGVCTPVSVNAAPAFPLVPTTTIAAAATVGYYTYVGYAQDAAGNASGTVTRVTAFDDPANIPTLSTAVFTAPLSSGSVTFSATAADNFDLRDVTYNLAYAGGLVGPIVYPTVTLGTYNGATLVNTAVPAGITIPNFVRQVENVTANGPVAVGGAFKPNAINGAVRDVVNNSSGAVGTLIGAAQVTTGVSYTLAAAPQLIRSWAITNAATNISSGAGPAAAVNPLSVTINVDAFGPTATFNAPFARVDLYAVVAGQLVQVGTTTSYVTQDDGSAFGRRHRYAISWTPGAAFALGASNLYAIGVNAAGDGLVTPLNANITVTNP